MKGGLAATRLPKKHESVLEQLGVVGITLSQILFDASVPNVGKVGRVRMVRLQTKE